MATGAKPAVQVTGAKELRKALARMGADLGDLTKIHKDLARIVSESAVQRVPVRSGKLRASIKGKGTKARATVTAGSRVVPYAGPIHFGWPARNIEPQPFLYDALDERKSEVARRYEEMVGDLVKRLDRETPG